MKDFCGESDFQPLSEPDFQKLEASWINRAYAEKAKVARVSSVAGALLVG